MDDQVRADFIAHLKRDIEELEMELRPLESGEMTIHKGPSGGPMRDTTTEEIGSLRSSIRSIKAVLSQYEN